MSEEQSILEIGRDQLLKNMQPLTLLVTGLLVDLHLCNGWIKRDQFVGIPTDIGKQLLGRDRYDHRDRQIMEALSLSFIGPANEVITLSCYASGTIQYPVHDHTAVIIPSDVKITIPHISDHNMEVHNPRLCVSVQIAEVIIGNGGYIDGNLINRNVPHDELDIHKRRY